MRVVTRKPNQDSLFMRILAVIVSVMVLGFYAAWIVKIFTKNSNGNATVSEHHTTATSIDGIIIFKHDFPSIEMEMIFHGGSGPSSTSLDRYELSLKDEETGRSCTEVVVGRRYKFEARAKFSSVYYREINGRRVEDNAYSVLRFYNEGKKIFTYSTSDSPFELMFA